MADSTAAAMLTINGQDEQLAAATLIELLAAKEISPDGRGVAIALNGAVVPRTAWATTALRTGDVVEIVRAMQGG